MSAASVRNDLSKLKGKLDIIMLQEFRGTWYWRVLLTLMDRNWRTYPSTRRSVRQPVKGGQAIAWRRKVVRKVRAFSSPAFDFSLDNSGIMENRWINAVLLEDKMSGLRCWYISTHFVVGGDEASDGELRKLFLRQNIEALNDVLGKCLLSGHPVVLGLDANIHKNSQAYYRFMKVLRERGGRVVGTHGVEYLVVFDNEAADVIVDRAYEFQPKGLGLKTDHEVRVIDHHLKGKTS